MPVSFPDFILHAAVEIFFPATWHAAFCVAFSVGYVYNLNNKIVMSASFQIVDVLYPLVLW